MFVVNCGLMQKDLIKLIEGFTLNGKQIFKCVKVEESQMYFESDLEFNDARKLVEEIIRGYRYHNILFYNVVPVVNGEIQWFS